MSNGISVQNSRVHKLGTFEPSNVNNNSAYNMNNGFGSTKPSWAGTIWGNGGLNGGFVDGAKDSARLRGTQAVPADEVEGKTGSSSLLESSESEGWNRTKGVPWTTSNPTKSLSPVRHRINDQPSTGQAAQTNGRSGSPYFTLGANVESHDNINTFQQRPSPPLGNGIPQKISENGPFGNFSTRENTTPNFSNSGSQHMPSLSRSISHGDSYSAVRAGYPAMKEATITRTITSSSIPANRVQPSAASHSSHNSVSGPMQRPTHSSHPSFHSLAYDTLDRSGADNIDFIPAFNKMGLQHSEKANSVHGADSGSPGSTFTLDSATDRSKYLFGQASAYASFTPQGVESAQGQNYQHGTQDYFKNGTTGGSGFLTPNASNARRAGANQTYPSASTPPAVTDMLNPSSESYSLRGSTANVVALDRKLRGLQPLQQEPASYIPAQLNQHGHLQGRLQFPPSSYDFAALSSIRMNPLANPYVMSPYLPFVQPPVGPRYTARDSDPIRSPLLEEFRTNNKTNKRFELKDIYGHVVEFAGDQHGSRFIQQKLETANSDEKEQIFSEIQPNSLQLMTDLFGNYVIQKLFEHGNQAQKKILANQMKGHIRSLSCQMYGCRVVQKALEHILTDQQAALISELDGKQIVMECLRDQNGNHVIQKAIERVPAEHIQFIIDAFLGQIAQLATHAYGCRVIQRMLEHCSEPIKRQILDELHVCIPALITDQFGNYVIQHVIAHGEESDRSRIISIVIGSVFAFSKHKFASNVVEKSIQYGAPAQRGELLRLLTSTNEKGESPVLGLVRDQFGNYVIQKVLHELKGAERENLINQIRPHIASLKKFSCAKQITAIEKIILDADFEANQSSQSSSLSSTNASTVDGPVTPAGVSLSSASIKSLVDESTAKTPTGPAVIAGVTAI